MRILFSIILALSCFSAEAGIRRYPGIGGDLGFYGDPNSFPANPGDTIVLLWNVTRSYFLLEGYRGGPDNHIVVYNVGGTANVEAIGFKHCHYMKLVKDDSFPIGFLMKPLVPDISAGLDIYGRSKVIDASGFHVERHGYMVWAKTDPSGSVDSLNHPNWIMDSIWIHDASAYNVGQDGIYAGNTSPNGIFLNGATRYPMRLSNLKIWNITMDSVNRTGIQASGVMVGDIHHNTITNCGYENNPDQGRNIIIGGHSYGVHVRDNIVRYSYSAGISNLGKGRNYVYRNIVDSAGVLQVNQFVNIDSLATAWGNAHSTDQFAYDLTKRVIYNSWQNPGSMFFTPDHDVLQYPTADSSSMVWALNKLGYARGGEKMQVFDYHFSNSKNPISYFNYVSGNTEMDGVTPYTTVGEYGFQVDFNWSTNISGLPLIELVLPYKFKFTYPKGTKILPRQRY